MRSAIGVVVLIAISAAAIPRQYPDDGKTVRFEALRQFLAWAHPEGNGCGLPEQTEIVERAEGFIRVRYVVPCASPRRLDALLEVHVGSGVWQVRGGYIASRQELDLALANHEARHSGAQGAGPDSPEPDRADRRPGGEGALPPFVSPPPEGLAPIDPQPGNEAILPALVIRNFPSETPAAARRARMFGSARVELLVDIDAGGNPLRARTLRGPDPDLGMRRAAQESVLRWRFRPARLAGRRVRSFVAVEIVFEGLPPESLAWIHRALFRYDGIITGSRRIIERAAARVRAGDRFEVIVAEFDRRRNDADGAGLVPAAALQAPVRRALHEAPIGEPVGPLEVDGRFYLLRKLGEVYFAIRSVAGEAPSYEVVHALNEPESFYRDQAIRDDIAGYLLENRRSAYVNGAARLMGIRQKRVQIGRLRIHTDVLSDLEVALIGRVVEATVGAHEEFWDRVIALRPLSQEILVFAYARQRDHDRLHRLWAGDGSPAASTEGEYIPASRILAIPCESMDGHLPVPYVIHEAIHMLNYERVYAEGVDTSRWFEEGLANYFGFSRYDSRLRIDSGDIGKSSPLNVEGFRIQFDPSVELREHLRKVRDAGPLGLRRLISAPDTDALWSGRRSTRAYGAAWTLVHFLLHGEKGGFRERFERYAALEAIGAGGFEAFQRIFPDLDALETAWHRYEAEL